MGRARGFADCPPSMLDKLVAAGHLRALARGEMLTRRGGSFDALAVLIEGGLESSITRADGHRLLLGYLQPGDMIGFIGLIDGRGHVTDLRAREPCWLLMLPRATLLSMRAQHPEIVAACERQLALRSRLLYDRLAADPSLPVEARLARLLLGWGDLYGLPRGDELLLDMKLSQADLADTLGVSRQRVNAAIKQLQQLGAIRTAYSKIALSDLARLREAALA